MDDLPPIPPLARATGWRCGRSRPSQHFTEPPPRFSEASLVKELERLGIGRPSTYSAIISTLAAREYVKVEQRRFFPTELGEMVEKIMVGKFPEIFNVEFTSEMENELDRIEEGELGWQRVLQDFYGPFTKALDGGGPERARRRGARPLAEDLAKERCPKCGSRDRAQDRAVRSLPRVREVQEHVRLREVAQEGARARPADRREVPPLRLADGDQDRDGSASSSPAPPIRRARAPAPIPLGIKCPKCLEGDLAERRTKRGKSFWGCVRYPACDFSTWNRRCPTPAPNCGWVGMEKKMSKAEGESRTCLKCGHKMRRRRARGGGAGVNATVVGGGLAGSEAAWALAERGVRVTLHRDAAGGADPGASAPIGSPSWSAATPSSRSISPTRTASSRPSCARSAACCCRARTRRACRAAPRWPWIASSSPSAVHRIGSLRIPTSRWCARRSPSCRRRGSSRPARSRRSAWPRRSRPGWARRRSRSTTPSRRSCPTTRSITTGCTPSPATGRAAGTTTSTRRSTRAEYEAFIDALVAADQYHGPRLRRGAVLRGVPAGRGDGAARAGDAALRADEAGRPSRPAHRARAARGGAAPRARTAPGRCGTSSASRPGSGSRSSSGCSA